LDKKGIKAERVLKYAEDNEKAILVRAFLRETRRKWNLTKKQQKLIKIFRG